VILLAVGLLLLAVPARFEGPPLLEVGFFWWWAIGALLFAGVHVPLVGASRQGRSE